MEVARQVHEMAQPRATVLFGSRARGDHREGSDIDILLVEEPARSMEQQDQMELRAQEIANRAHGGATVQLVWVTLEAFRKDEVYLNSIPTRALLDGVVLTDHPEEFRSRYRDGTARRVFDWRTYEYALRHSGAELQMLGIYLDISEGRKPKREMPRELYWLNLANTDATQAGRSLLSVPGRALRHAFTAALEATAQHHKPHHTLEGLRRNLEALAPEKDTGTQVPLENYERGEMPPGMTLQEFVETAERDISNLRNLAMGLRRRTGQAAGKGRAG